MSKPRLHLLLIGILVVGVMLVFALAGRGMPTYAAPLFGPLRETKSFEFIRDPSGEGSVIITVSRFEPGSGFANFLLTNNKLITGTITLDIPNLPDGWSATFSPPPTYVLTDTVANIGISLKLTVPANTAIGSPNPRNLRVRATLLSDKLPTRPVFTTTVQVPVKLESGSATAGAGCPDEPAPGTDFDNARLLRVDISELHGLCAIGEQDWFRFTAVGSKYYSIEIAQSDPGLDLALDLFDNKHKQITSNDDFPTTPTPAPATMPTPNLTPTPTSTTEPPPDQILPRIKSFRAPYSGLYYIRVRDAADLGGNNATYQIIIRSESYGTDPVLVPEICNDHYEPDGVAENARMIMVNQTQTDHRLCPTGDADWVKFYALAGQTYAMYVNTNSHGPLDAKGAPTKASEPGADTQLYIFGPDGRTVWGYNDNTGATSVTTTTAINPLDSALRFKPATSGFYYAQIKNNGDIGDQQILYDLTFASCDASNVAYCSSGTTLIESPVNAGAQAGEGLAPDVAGFAFLRQWQEDDEPVARQQVKRSWIWGEWGNKHPPRQLGERYDQAPGGVRQVAYFDKGRMEVNNPTGDQNSRWFITSGRLVAELITGSIQTGDTTAEQRSPANIPIAGNTDDADGPTYASFGGATSLSAADRTGQNPSEQIYRNGRVGPYAGANDPQTKLAQFVDATRHNIPKVFLSYFKIAEIDWVYMLGYPLSEPYWAYVRVGGAQTYVLIQPFERRVLTYNPGNLPAFQVEMGNVGLHYYQWRYLQR